MSTQTNNARIISKHWEIVDTDDMTVADTKFRDMFEANGMLMRLTYHGVAPKGARVVRVVEYLTRDIQG